MLLQGDLTFVYDRCAVTNLRNTYLVARTDSDTNDCPTGGAGSRSEKCRAPLNPNVGSDCSYVCPLPIRAGHTSTLVSVWGQILRGLKFPCDGGQTDRFRISDIEPG